MGELEQRLEEVKEQVKGERGKREEAEEMVSRLSQELENEEKELMEVKAAFVDLSKKYTDGEELAKLKDNVDHIKAENFEHIIENEELKTKLAASLEKSEKMKKELEKVKSEKKRLELSAKREKESEGERRREREEVESPKSDLRVEREKVRELASRQMALVDENKELKEENDRLYSKTEQLEQLMGEEVTDINEILAVINNIQASQTLLSPKVVGQAQQERKWL